MMTGLARPVYIVAAKRTAFGSFGGKLKGVTATVMGQHAAVAAMEAGKVDPAIVDSSVFGNVIQVKYFNLGLNILSKENLRLVHRSGRCFWD